MKYLLKKRIQIETKTALFTLEKIIIVNSWKEINHNKK